MRLPGRHRIVSLVLAACPVAVERALRVLRVEDPVRVHAGRKRRVVLEVDDDRVADLGLDRRPEEAQVAPLGRDWNALPERVVGVLAVSDLRYVEPIRSRPRRTKTFSVAPKRRPVIMLRPRGA
jgi:hypothetical protein